MDRMRSVTQTMRAGLALALGFSFMVFMGCSLIVMAAAHRRIFPRRSILQSFLIRWPHYFVLIADTVCNRWILRLRETIEGTIEPLRAGERVICFANHPTTCGLVPFLRVITSLASRVEFTLKIEHSGNIIGWALERIGCAFYVDRTSKQMSAEQLAAATDDTQGVATIVLIFPDAHRPTRARRITACHARAQGSPVPRLQTLLPPRTGFALEALRRFPNARVIASFSGLSIHDEGFADLALVCDADCTIFVRDNIRRPALLDRSSVGAMLRELWTEADHKITSLRIHDPRCSTQLSSTIAS